MKAKAPGGFDAAVEDVLMTRLRSVEGVHGLGYEAMSASSVLDERYGRIASAFKTKAKSRGIRGQAFGVGAFEEDDENIYSNYDLNQFDFALDAPGTSEEGPTTVDSSFVMSEKVTAKFPTCASSEGLGVSQAAASVAGCHEDADKYTKSKVGPIHYSIILG
ncbi:hypothetical protein TELCIR_22049 [Teladorsagia circumcincta]|uniref:Uncharacterized protein n=1 Tax=Teladorsagia circumcincta TaxID=45464 RepID=A0A2G9TF22_TELCI|nr:hypothetical protein TELCIR_22049 [Teladorsagia circumcincta]